jgi:hypothetical protein
LHRREVFETCGPWDLPEDLIDGVDFVFQRRAFLAGHRFAGTGQVSVIKFPSPDWKTYDRSKDFPQSEYMNKMQQGPNELHTWLLTQLVLVSVQRDEDLNIWPSLRMSLKAAYWRGIDWYGRERWPVFTYLRWKHRRWRRRAVAFRGLSPISSDQTLNENAGTTHPKASSPRTG